MRAHDVGAARRGLTLGAPGLPDSLDGEVGEGGKRRGVPGTPYCVGIMAGDGGGGAHRRW